MDYTIILITFLVIRRLTSYEIGLLFHPSDILPEKSLRGYSFLNALITIFEVMRLFLNSKDVSRLKKLNFPRYYPTIRQVKTQFI